MTAAQNKEYELMKELEGCSYKVYTCPAGFKTVGVGFNMEQSGSMVIWKEVGAVENFEDVIEGRVEISEDTCYKLFNHFWRVICEGQVRTRCVQLGIDYNAAEDYRQFVWKDIVYNTGSIKNWKKVLLAKDPKKVMYEARRNPKELMDSRVCKIANAYGICNSVAECKQIGLEYAKYV